MHEVKFGIHNPVHRYKCCNACDKDKPPEGGIDMGHKWICQACWIAKKTGKKTPS
jgi:hypothetical protein